MLILLVTAYLAGVITIGFTFFYIFCNEKESPKEHVIEEPKLPPSLDEGLKNPDGYQQRETCISLNLLLQFLFQERQHDITIHRWLMNYLKMEFAELLKHRTFSKLFHRIEIQSISLGSNLPVLKTIYPSLIKFLKDSSVLDLIHLDIDVEYTGGFDITIDAYSKIAKKAIIKIKVENLSGPARLIFSRQPFSHWGISFCEEPKMKFDIQSSVLGHRIPKLRSIINNQLQNLIRRKYILPYYKIRSRPLIQTPPELIPDSDSVVIRGKLNICLVKFSRLQENLFGSSMWCTISISETKVVCVYEHQNELWMILDVEIAKNPQVPIGFVLKPGADFQIVDFISPQSPAFQAGIKKGDFIIDVNGQLESSGVHTARLIADSWNKGDDSAVIIRIKRFIISTKKISTDHLIPKDDLTIGNETYEKSFDEGRDRQDSKSDTISLEETISEVNCLESEGKWLLSEERDSKEEEIGRMDSKTLKHVLGDLIHGKSDADTKLDDKLIMDSQSGSVEVKTEFKYAMRRFPVRCRPIVKYFESSSFESSSEPYINAECAISLDEDCRFVNVCLWSKGIKEKTSSTEKSPKRERRGLKRRQVSKEITNICEDGIFADDNVGLVGYANFFVEKLIDESSLNTMGHVVKVEYLKPISLVSSAATQHPLAHHKGFQRDHCYGDVMISVLYTPPVKSNGKDAVVQSDDDYMTDTSVSDDEEEVELGQEREHVFQRTHFTSATHCDFCKKKIWLKDAVQCSVCGIICHKKCMSRCREATACDLSGLRYKEIRDLDIEMPEIIMPDEEEVPITRHSQIQNSKHSLGALLNHMGSATGSYISRSGIKRTGSVHNLDPLLTSDGSSHSRSLPPSPRVTPQHSRKTSLVGNPFLTDHLADDMELFLEKSLEEVLSYPHIDNLHKLAKQSASLLLTQYDNDERASKIKIGLDILQKWISSEGNIRRHLAKQEKEAFDGSRVIERARLSLLIAECDSRTQAVALITMHYFTAQQIMAEESLQIELPKDA